MLKKVFCMFILAAMLLSMAGCEVETLLNDILKWPGEREPWEPQLPAQTEPPVVIPAETEPPVVIPAETEPATEPAPQHSELYIPGLAVEDVILYFNEVCLDAEFSDSGDPSLLQKWGEPIFYQVNGDPTPEDLAVLEGFAAWLNTLEGFPGIREAGPEQGANLQIWFCSSEELIERMGDHLYGSDGAVTYWYDDNRIYDEIICIRNDLDQYLRNSVILEEVYNGLGPVQDTALRPDSLIYSEFSEPQELTDIDELILKLLYHPDMVWGMNAEQCEEVIRRLYY